MADKDKLILTLRPIDKGIVLWKLDFLKLVKKCLYWTLKAPKVVMGLNTMSSFFGVTTTTAILLKLFNVINSWTVIFICAGLFLVFALCEAGVIVHIQRVMEKLQSVFVVKDLVDDGVELKWATGYKSIATNSHICAQPWLEHFIEDIELQICRCVHKDENVSDEKVLAIRAKVEDAIEEGVKEAERKRKTKMEIPVYSVDKYFDK